MSKFHINKRGVPAVCRAKPGNCPLGGDSGNENHYNTEEEAQAAATAQLQSEHGILKELNSSPSEKLRKEFPQLSESQLNEVQSYYDKEFEVQQEVRDLESSDDEYKATDEYFDRVQAVRQEALKKYEQGRKTEEIIGEDNVEAVKEGLKSRVEEVNGPKPPWGGQSSTIMEETFDEGVGTVFTAYSGKDMETIKADIKEIQNSNENMEYGEAAQRYWATLKRRTDKPIVSIDFETANPNADNSLSYDNGQLTYIIDVGAIKTYPDGTEERIEFYSGVPESFEKTHGTGFQQTHNIAPEDIRGVPEFTGSENAKKLEKFLDGTVMMAHFASFEEKQLTNSMRGMRQKFNDGSIEVLDTWKYSKFLIPENKSNANKAMVESAGMEYENAHRGMSDAQMTWSAFNIHKKRQEDEYK